MWQAGLPSHTTTTLHHVVRLIAAVAVTTGGSGAFQQPSVQLTRHPSDDPHLFPLAASATTTSSRLLRAHCDANAAPPASSSASLYPSRTTRISVLRDSSPQQQQTPETTPKPTTVSAAKADNASASSSPTPVSNDDASPHPPLEEKEYVQMSMPERGQLDGHAIFGSLHGETMIEQYQIWKRKSQPQHRHYPQEEAENNNITSTNRGDDDDNNDNNDNDDVVIGFVTFGSHLNGHPSLVHGGIISLMFDDMCGFAYEAVGVRHAVTANLTVNYRAPVPAGSQVRLAVQLESKEGRKLFWKAQMTSLDQQVLYAEATSLYIIPK